MLHVELINTGSELMLGRVLNTHQQWLCRRLADLGYPVARQVAVDDSGPAIVGAVREALARSDLLVVTGGLGPTSDDRTRELIAGMLGLTLSHDDAVAAHIDRLFAARGQRAPSSTRVQAQVPRGATVLLNACGTAPGLVVQSSAGVSPRSCLLVLLPGPPRELRPMFENQVVPLLREQLPPPTPFFCRTLRTTGLGESLLEERIAGPLAPLTEAGLELGYCARMGEVDVRFVARGEQAGALVGEAERITRELLGDLVFAVDDEQLEATLVRLLTGRLQTVAVAESCTGGWISNRLTNVPGASAVFLAGLVTYSNEAKQRFLNVRADTLATEGAVSEATAREMAEGVRRQTGADFAVAVTGIAGPAGGTPEKAVGTVWMAVASAQHTVAQRRVNAHDRETFKSVTSQQALDLLRRQVLGGSDRPQ